MPKQSLCGIVWGYSDAHIPRNSHFAMHTRRRGGGKSPYSPFSLFLATASLCGLLIGCFELLIFVFVFPSLLYPRRSFVYIRNVYNAGWNKYLIFSVVLGAFFKGFVLPIFVILATACVVYFWLFITSKLMVKKIIFIF